MVLRIHGKGQTNRDVMLSPTLLAMLRAWWRVHQLAHWLFPGPRPETRRSARDDHGVRHCELARRAPAAGAVPHATGRLSAAAEPAPLPDYRDRYEALTGVSLRTCPVCHDGHMLVIESLARDRGRPALLDSS